MESLGSVMGESLWRYDNITPERVTSAHAYAAAGRLVKEGDKMYSYGWLDKIVNVQENGTMVAAFDYHINGQIASATYADKTENFLWDGLALIHRAGTNYINEPYVTGGNPILSSKDGVMFNDMLGTTLGVKSGEQVNQVNMTAFGEPLRPATNGDAAKSQDAFFTGKPHIGELGYAFLFRNYRPEQGKWQTADPLGYPDGWNNFAYVNNGVCDSVDAIGTKTIICREVVGGIVKHVWMEIHRNGKIIAAAGFYPFGDESTWGLPGRVMLGTNEGHITDSSKDYLAVYDTSPGEEFLLLQKAKNDDLVKVYNPYVYSGNYFVCDSWIDEVRSLIEAFGRYDIIDTYTDAMLLELFNEPISQYIINEYKDISLSRILE